MNNRDFLVAVLNKAKQILSDYKLMFKTHLDHSYMIVRIEQLEHEVKEAQKDLDEFDNRKKS